ncbi:hypothetical protein OHA60_06590 [Streptomyces cellulosae]|jgi:hypothetical protein|nr:hypothetical protein OHA60_06590 [Streptomyces cellulosae]
MSADAEPSSSPGAAQAVAHLAALAEGRHRFHRDKGMRSRTLRLATGPMVEIPGPKLLATIVLPVVAAGRDLMRDRDTLLARASPGAPLEPVGLRSVIDAVTQFVTSLPDRGTTGTPYDHLRMFATEATPATRNEYFAEVARAVRRAAPSVPKPPREARPKLTPEQREARLRESKRRYARNARAQAREGETADQEAAAAWLLKFQEVKPPGTVVAPSALKSACDDAFKQASREPVGRNKFFKIADEAVGPRVRRRIDGRPQPAYVTREVNAMSREERRNLARLIVDKIAEDWKADALAGVADLIAERDELRTAVDDATRGANVIPLRRTA